MRRFLHGHHSLQHDLTQYIVHCITMTICNDDNLNKFEEPPHSVLTLKGGYPMICCPKDDGRPQTSLFSSQTIRICTDDEIYDYFQKEFGITASGYWCDDKPWNDVRYIPRRVKDSIIGKLSKYESDNKEDTNMRKNHENSQKSEEEDHQENLEQQVE